MSSTRKRDGTILHFPTLKDSVNVIEPPPADELVRIADEIDPSGMPLFTKRLISGAMKKQHKPRWQKANEARLVLARHCIDRMLARGEPEPA